ncbi:DUF493 family protein [Bacteriovoracaceae bacterium]|nr:DUF493 family protein [Bacteriovoracaceae bacterium]
MDDFSKMKELLDNEYEWPADYIFKFIVPLPRLSQLMAHFLNDDVETKTSKTGKYISATIVKKMNSSDDVIKIYKEMKNIEGIISL